MNKDLRQHIAESDKEIKVEIIAPFDMHTDLSMQQIRRALAKYDLRSIEKGFRKQPQLAHDNAPRASEFGGMVVTEMTSVIAYLGIFPATGPEGLAQEIGMLTLIPDKFIEVKIDGFEKMEKPDLEDSDARDFGGTTDRAAALARQAKKKEALVGSPYGRDEEAKGAQDLVGQKRVHELVDRMAELQAEAKKAGEQILKFVTTHIALGEATGEPRRKGYYICERKASGDGFTVLGGPVPEPGNLPVVHNLKR